MKEGTTRLGDDKCPVCGTLVDSATDAYGTAKPMPGDISICMYCASVNKYGDDMGIVEMGKEEVNFLDDKTKLLIDRAQAMILKTPRH